MATKKAANHVHKYKKFNLGQNGRDYLVYKCMKADCTHYVPILLAEGKIAECNRCETPFIISKLQLTGSHGKAMTRPHCVDCIKRKKSADVDAITQFLAENKI